MNILRGDVSLPVAIIRASALDRNQAWMSAFARHAGAVLCPHAKTTMSPELIRRQLDAGAWGLTAATPAQVRALRSFGVSRILLANQLVGPNDIAWIARELAKDPAFDFYALVDSLQCVRRLEEALVAAGFEAKLQVLVEVGMPKARTGARSLDAALEVARAASRSAVLSLRGVECYEGVPPADDPGASIEGLFRLMGGLLEQAEAQGLFATGPVLVSAGGSTHYDLAGEAMAEVRLRSPVLRVLRGGCYIVHDARWAAEHLARMRARAPEVFAGFPPPPVEALEVWGWVQALPDPGRVILAMGKRDVSYDMHLPVPRFWFRPGAHARPEPLLGHAVAALNDQHAHLEAPEGSPLQFGDMVGVGVSHPCTTFDKWRVLPIVDDEYEVVELARTFINDRLYGFGAE